MAGIEYSLSRPLAAGEVLALFRQTSWAADRQEAEVARMVSASVCVGAWDGERLIGFARVLTDGVYRAFLEDVVIDEAYRGSGVGAEMVRQLMERVGHVEDIILTTSENRRAFYTRLGFHTFEHVHMHTKRDAQATDSVDAG